MERFEFLASVELLASVEPPAADELCGKSDDLQTALERLELPASIELLATVERLAEDGFPGEGDDLQTALERLEEVLDGRVVAIARHPDQRRVVQVGLRLDELLDDFKKILADSEYERSHLAQQCLRREETSHPPNVPGT